MNVYAIICVVCDVLCFYAYDYHNAKLPAGTVPLRLPAAALPLCSLLARAI
jgi:hypothetical protein